MSIPSIPEPANFTDAPDDELPAEVLEAAREIALCEGWDWSDLSAASQDAYIEKARRDFLNALHDWQEDGE